MGRMGVPFIALGTGSTEPSPQVIVFASHFSHKVIFSPSRFLPESLFAQVIFCPSYFSPKLFFAQAIFRPSHFSPKPSFPWRY
jgi:hypothetical protein